MFHELKDDMVIVVNATATRSSGGLSILKQFLDNIPIETIDKYYIFVDPEINIPKTKHIIPICMDTKKWSKRIYWDSFGFKKWIKKNNINPNVIISLQNTGVNYNQEIPQLIYYHQLLPLSKHRWNILKKEELILFIYKYFYSFFVSLYIHNKTYFVVQIPSTKKKFIEKFKIKEDNVFVIPPKIPLIDNKDIPEFSFKDNKKHFIYPATLFVYKNHLILLKALSILKKKDKECFNNIKIHFTFTEKEAKNIKTLIQEYNIESTIAFEGTIPYKQLFSYYKSMNALLFPSYIESFGLPLLEAAGCGIPIIASNLPYAHDVIGLYEGVTFIDYNNAEDWANAIIEKYYKKGKFKPFTYPSDRGNWNVFFNLIEQLK